MRSLRPDKPWTTKLSSAGLVYCHFGSQILAGLLGQPEDSPVVKVLYDKVLGEPRGCWRGPSDHPSAAQLSPGLPLGGNHPIQECFGVGDPVKEGSGLF